MSKKTKNGVLPYRFMVSACAFCACVTPIHAFEINTGESDVRLYWDSTVKYTIASRLKDQSPGLNLEDDDNQDDGNNNFDKGLVSNRLDLFSELDLGYSNFGARISGAAWYDAVYNQDTDNQTVTSNNQAANEFPEDTQEIMGGDVELLDAFAYARIDLPAGTGTLRLGQHSVIWGESFFFGANGIAGGMAPIDVIKLQSVPNTTFKEAAIPIASFSADIPLSETVSAGAFVGFDWKKSRLQPAGAYLSTSDVLEGNRIITGPLFTEAPTFENQPDLEPDDNQLGLKLTWFDENSNTDFGLYALRYNSFGPSSNNLLVIPPPDGAGPTAYRWYYHEGVKTIGASFARSVSSWSLAGEVSYRDNVALASQPTPPNVGAYVYDNENNTSYAVGSTTHAQFSWLASLGPSFISSEASFVGEIARNQVATVDKQAGFLNPLTDDTSTSLRMIYKPTYRQAFSGLDLAPSIGISHTWGKSAAVGPSFGVDKGGDLTLGLDAVYLGKWKFSAKYVSFYGPEGSALNADNTVQFRQALKDRDFISFSVTSTF